MGTKNKNMARPVHADMGTLLPFVFAALALLGFLLVASEVSSARTLAFDQAVVEGLREPASPATPAGPKWLRRVMLDVTALGGGTVLTIITGIVVLYLLVVKKWATALFVAIAVAAGGAANDLLKATFLRARPDVVEHLTEAYSTSFPSGHAMNSALTYLTLAALLARTQNNRRVRVYLIAVAVLLTLSIGFSRVYLGVHWPTDVIAGWCVGAAWALVFTGTARALQRRRAIEAPEAPTQDILR